MSICIYLCFYLCIHPDKFEYLLRHSTSLCQCGAKMFLLGGVRLTNITKGFFFFFFCFFDKCQNSEYPLKSSSAHSTTFVNGINRPLALLLLSCIEVRIGSAQPANPPDFHQTFSYWLLLRTFGGAFQMNHTRRLFKMPEPCSHE